MKGKPLSAVNRQMWRGAGVGRGGEPDKQTDTRTESKEKDFPESVAKKRQTKGQQENNDDSEKRKQKREEKKHGESRVGGNRINK